MSIEYRELETEDDFDQCINLQKGIFNFSDVDVVSQLVLRLIARDNPPMGISLGVFKNVNSKSELIGFVLAFATFNEKSVYIVLMGIKPEYQNGVYGYKLLLKFREVAITKCLHTMHCVFEPLESNLARLYCESLGFQGIKYNLDSGEHQIPSDKMFVKWEFTSKKVSDKIERSREVKREDIDLSILANEKYFPETNKVLIEIPNNFIQLKEINLSIALHWRLSTRKLFNEYINNRGYIVSDCISKKTENGRKTYYMLEKRDMQ